METEAHRMLRRLAAAVEARRPLPDDVADWIAAGLREYLDAGAGTSLDRALGLKGAGVRSFATIERHRRRNAALMAALEFAHDGEPTPAGERAGRLAEAVRRFKRRKWPRIQHLEEPPTGLSALEKRLFRAFRTGMRIPESDRQIRACVLPPSDDSRK